jgi:hypothetical protein
LAANTKNGKIYKVFQDGDTWDSNLLLYSYFTNFIFSIIISLSLLILQKKVL